MAANPVALFINFDIGTVYIGVGGPRRLRAGYGSGHRRESLARLATIIKSRRLTDVGPMLLTERGSDERRARRHHHPR